MMLNQTELRAAVRKHCGWRMDKNEPICEPCEKKLKRAKRIEKQIDDMWRKYHTGYFDHPPRRRDAENPRKDFRNSNRPKVQHDAPKKVGA